MKSITTFIRTTIAGGILFLIPIVIILTVLKKAMEIMERITTPLNARLQWNIIWGFDGHNLLGIILLLIVCFLGGLVFRLSRVKTSVHKIESKVLSYVPGYVLIKSLATEALSDDKGDVFAPVLIKDDESHKPGFLVEEKNGHCTVFFPEPPEATGGELQIVQSKNVIKLNISGNAMKHLIRSFGKGVIDVIPPSLSKNN